MWQFSLFSEGSAALAANINLEPQGVLQPPIHPTTSLTVPCASCFEGNEFQIVLIRLSHFNSHATPFFGGHCFDLSVTQPLPNPPSLSSSSDCECPNQPIVQLQSGPKAHTALAGTKVLQNKEKMAPAPVVETIPQLEGPTIYSQVDIKIAQNREEVVQQWLGIRQHCRLTLWTYDWWYRKSTHQRQRVSELELLTP